jgi:signal transduction histidine kinase
VTRRLRALTDRDWRVLDRVLAAMLTVFAVITLATSTNPDGPLAANVAAAAAMGASLVWRRTRPLAVGVFVCVAGLLMELLLTSPPDAAGLTVIMVAVAYSMGAHLDRRESLVGLAMVVSTVLLIALLYLPSDVFWPVTFFAFVPWLAGRTIRNHTMLARELAEKAERAEHAREEEERRAIAAERARIARELHDVLAHNLSVMVVQAGAARRVLERDPERAVASADLIQQTGREALHELRHLFGAVRRGEGEDLFGPPSLARLDGLVERARAAGLRVALRVEGEPVPLPTGVDLTAYRVVQEALTNTLKHAGAAEAAVVVSYEPNEVVLSIEDDGVGPDGDLTELGGGHGLVGMRERVQLYGGILQAGRRRGGGFAVRARLPTKPLVPGAELSGTPRVPA